MKLYLIRHTSVDVPQGTCYGQSNVPLKSSFEEEAEIVKQNLNGIEVFFGCRKYRLVETVFDFQTIRLDGLNFEKGRVVKLSQVSEFRAAIERFSANDRFRAASGLEIRPYLNNEGLVLHIVKHGQEAVPQGSKITLPRSMRDDYKNCTFYSPQSQQTPLIYDKSSGMLSGIPQMGIYSVIKCN